MSLAVGREAFLMQAQLSQEALFPGEIQLPGETEPVVCARSGDEYVQRGENGGYEEDVRIVIRVRDALLSEDPRVHLEEVAVLDSRNLRVKAATLESGDVAWLVELEEQ